MADPMQIIDDYIPANKEELVTLSTINLYLNKQNTGI